MKLKRVVKGDTVYYNPVLDLGLDRNAKKLINDKIKSEEGKSKLVDDIRPFIDSLESLKVNIETNLKSQKKTEKNYNNLIRIINGIKSEFEEKNSVKVNLVKVNDLVRELEKVHSKLKELEKNKNEINFQSIPSDTLSTLLFISQLNTQSDLSLNLSFSSHLYTLEKIKTFSDTDTKYNELTNSDKKQKMDKTAKISLNKAWYKALDKLIDEVGKNEKDEINVLLFLEEVKTININKEMALNVRVGETEVRGRSFNFAFDKQLKNFPYVNHPIISSLEEIYNAHKNNYTKINKDLFYNYEIPLSTLSDYTNNKIKVEKIDLNLSNEIYEKFSEVRNWKQKVIDALKPIPVLGAIVNFVSGGKLTTIEHAEQISQCLNHPESIKSEKDFNTVKSNLPPEMQDIAQSFSTQRAAENIDQDVFKKRLSEDENNNDVLGGGDLENSEDDKDNVLADNVGKNNDILNNFVENPESPSPN